MAALATLSSTTLAAPCSRDTTQVYLTSVTNVIPGLCFWAHPGRELFQVVSLGPAGSTLVNVKRGVEGSAATPHIAGETVYIGRNDQFYVRDPMSGPPPEVLVQPWINTHSGNVFWPFGDDSGPGTAARVWQLATTTNSFGVLGVHQRTTSPTGAQ